MNIHIFTGKELDETGLYYFGARYYDKSLGRWIVPDPESMPSDLNLRDPQTLNPYVYCRNNPLRLLDPDGTAHFTAQEWQWCQQAMQSADRQYYSALVHYENEKQPGMEAIKATNIDVLFNPDRYSQKSGVLSLRDIVAFKLTKETNNSNVQQNLVYPDYMQINYVEADLRLTEEDFKNGKTNAISYNYWKTGDKIKRLVIVTFNNYKSYNKWRNSIKKIQIEARDKKSEEDIN